MEFPVVRMRASDSTSNVGPVEGTDPGWEAAEVLFWAPSNVPQSCFWSGKLFCDNSAPHLLPALSRLVSCKAGSWLASGFNLLVILRLFDVSPSFSLELWKDLFFFCDREMTKTQLYFKFQGASHLLRAFCVQISKVALKAFFFLFALSLSSFECIFFLFWFSSNSFLFHYVIIGQILQVCLLAPRGEHRIKAQTKTGSCFVYLFTT